MAKGYLQLIVLLKLQLIAAAQRRSTDHGCVTPPGSLRFRAGTRRNLTEEPRETAETASAVPRTQLHSSVRISAYQHERSQTA